MDVPTAILAVRLTINDTATSHYCAPDNMEAQIDGIRNVFKLSNRNIIKGNGSAFYIADGGAPQTVDPSDCANGISALGTAPQQSLEWYYYYQNYLDAEVQQFLDTGLAEVNLTESQLANMNPATSASDQALFTIISHYAAAEAYHTLMARFAESFNSSVAGEDYQLSDIYKAYQKLHDTHIADANSKREEFYKKQGRRFQTYSNTGTAGQPTNALWPRR